jgi:hypothetical protein
MKRLLKLLSMTYLAVIVAMSCGADKTGGDPVVDVVEQSETASEVSGDWTVETDLSSHEVTVGEAFTVECFIQGPDGSGNAEAEVVFTQEDDEFVHEPGDISIDKLGDFTVACRVKGTDLRDETPELLSVSMGPIVRIETTLDKSTLNAGDSALVTCTAFDSADNKAIIEPGVTVAPEEGVVVEEQSITGEKPGDYVVTCIAEKGIEVTSADLTIVEGDPAKFIASVDPDTVGVGEYSQVSCSVEDAAGNPVQAEWQVEAPEDVKIAGTQVFTTVAGTHGIKCAPVDTGVDAKLDSATLTVLAGEPVDMLVYPKPDKDHYCLAEQVQVKHELVDEYGNVVEDAVINPIDVTPAGGLELQAEKDDKFNFVGEGVFNLKVQATDHDYSGEITVLCDCSGPQITITYPPRGATFDGPANMVVTGYVEDAVSEVTGITINDESVTIDGDGGFSFPMLMIHGMNMIQALAQDSLGNEGKRFRSPFYSTDYYIADSGNAAAGMVTDAIMVFLSQDFIDDGDHSMPADDLATIVEIIVGGMDLGSLLPEGGMELMDGATAQIMGLEMGKPYVELQSVDGGIHMIITIPDLVVEIELEVCQELPFVGEVCQSAYGFIYIDVVVAEAYIFIGVAEDGSITAGLGPISLEFENLDVDLYGIVGNLFDPLVNMVVNILKETLIEQLSAELDQQLPEILEQTLGSLAEGQVVELPPLIGDGDPVELLLSVEFDKLEFTYDGLDLELTAALTAPKGIAHSPLGAMARDGCLGTQTEPFALPKDAEMNAGLAVDFVNEALYSIWYSGAITLDLTAEDLGSLDVSQYGIENLSLSTDLYYAPILQSCGTGEAFELQLGDAFIHAEFDMMMMHWDIDIFLYLVLEATPELLEDEVTGEVQIGIVIGELKVAEVDVVKVGDDLKGKESMVENLFSGVLIPTLMDEALGSLGGFAIPSFDLSGVDPAIPAGTEISVDLQELGVLNGYLLIGGKLK